MEEQNSKSWTLLNERLDYIINSSTLKQRRKHWEALSPPKHACFACNWNQNSFQLRRRKGENNLSVMTMLGIRARMPERNRRGKALVIVRALARILQLKFCASLLFSLLPRQHNIKIPKTHNQTQTLITVACFVLAASLHTSVSFSFPTFRTQHL